MGESATVRTEDGRVIPISEVGFGDFEIQALYEIAGEFPDSVTANRFLQIYRDSGVDVPEFLQVYLDELRKDMQGRVDVPEDLESVYHDENVAESDESDIIKPPDAPEENGSGDEDEDDPNRQPPEGPERIITEIKYKPSSGAVLKATPGRTTTILGNFDKDMRSIVGELDNIKSIDFGPRNGGFNVLNVPDEIYNKMTRLQFWETYNKPWLDNVIQRGDDIVLATKPEGKYLSYTDKTTGEEVITSFGREFKYLTEKGYIYDAMTNKMIRK